MFITLLALKLNFASFFFSLIVPILIKPQVIKGLTHMGRCTVLTNKGFTHMDTHPLLSQEAQLVAVAVVLEVLAVEIVLQIT